MYEECKWAILYVLTCLVRHPASNQTFLFFHLLGPWRLAVRGQCSALLPNLHLPVSAIRNCRPTLQFWSQDLWISNVVYPPFLFGESGGHSPACGERLSAMETSKRGPWFCWGAGVASTMPPRHLGPGRNIDMLIVLPPQQLTPLVLERPCCKRMVLPAQQSSPAHLAIGSSDLCGHLQLFLWTISLSATHCVTLKEIVHRSPRRKMVNFETTQAFHRLSHHREFLVTVGKFQDWRLKHLQGASCEIRVLGRHMLDGALLASICSFCGYSRLVDSPCILPTRNPVKGWLAWIAATVSPQSLPSLPTSIFSAGPPLPNAWNCLLQLSDVSNCLEELSEGAQQTSEPAIEISIVHAWNISCG